MQLLNNVIKFTHNKLKVIRSRKFYKSFIDKGDMVYDIGANIGRKSEIFLSIGAHVVCVEPQSACVEVLKKKFTASKSITIVDKAISNRNGFGEMFISNVSEVSTLSKQFIEVYKDYPGINWNLNEKVKLTTLSNLLEVYGTPKYIKVDVEGYERHVLETLPIPIQYISFEYNKPLKSNAIECINLLSRYPQYKFNFMIHEDMRLSLKNWKGSTEFIDFIDRLPDTILTGEVFCSYNKVIL